MAPRNPDDPASEAHVGAKRAFFEDLDAQLAAAGHPVRPPAPAPPPAPPGPALPFEVWAELSVRLLNATRETVAQAVAPYGLSLDGWLRLSREHRSAMDVERRSGGGPLTTIYMARLSDLYSGRLALPDPPAPQAAPAVPAAAAPPETPASPPVPDALRGTVNTPDIAPEGWEVLGRSPFLPAAPEAPAAPGKGSAKTVKSMPAVPSELGGTFPIGTEMVGRPTPSLPFVGSPGDDGVLPVPDRTAMELVALTVELWLKPATIEETLGRYRVGNEAAYRALVALHRAPGRQEQVVEAVDHLAKALRRALLG